MKKKICVILSILLIMTFAITFIGLTTIDVSSIKMNSKAISIKVGNTYTLKVAITPSNATNKKLTYSSGNKNIATVDQNGRIKGIKAGKTVITITSVSNKKAVAKCTVIIVAQSNLNPAGKFPIVNKPVTLRVFTSPQAWLKPIADSYVAKWYEKLTNVKIKWEEVVASDATTKLNLMLASKTDLPDVIMQTMDPQTVMTYGEQGVFIPLNSMIDNLGFGIKIALQYDPKVLPQITSPDGNIYTMFHTYEGGHGDYMQKMWINQSWLKNLGLKMPETTDEFYNVLKAFKDKDANKNGDPNDEIPLSGSHNKGWSYSIDGFLMNPFIFNSGSNSNRIMLENDKVIAAYMQPEWREGLKYINRLYKEGLLDKDVFTQDYNQVRQLVGSSNGNRVGAFPTGALSMYVDISKDTKLEYAALLPLKGPKDLRQSPYYYPGVNMKFAITNVCKEPEAAFRWGDAMYLAAQNGGPFEKNGFWEWEGEEGKSWARAKEGDVGMFGQPAVWRWVIPYGTSGFQGWETQGTVYNTNQYKTNMVTTPGVWDQEKVLLDATIAYAKYNGNKSVPPLNIINNDDYLGLKTAINNYVEESLARFITGDLALNDSNWNNYLKELDKIGVSKYLDIIQKQYNAQYKK